MSPNESNAKRLAILWHKLLQNPSNNICTEKLKSASVLDINILRLLREKKSATVKDILKMLSVTQSTLSSAIRRLEKKQLIERTMCKTDLRSYSLMLTDEGKAEIDEYGEKELLIMTEMLNKLESVEKQDILLDLLEKIF